MSPTARLPAAHLPAAYLPTAHLPTARLDDILTRADIIPLLDDIEIGLGDAGSPSFVVESRRRALIAPAAFDPDGTPVVRHALELCFLLGVSPGEPVLAGLMAARCAALFRVVTASPEAGALPRWHAAMAADAAPAAAELQALWPDLALHQPGAPRAVPAATAARLAELWPLLGPTEVLIAAGGDARLNVDPDTGLNAYGCSPRPRPWAITFASSTASSISERGYAAAEAARRHALGEALRHGAADSLAEDAARIRRAIAGHYGLAPDVRILIVPSGTDGELLALAVALAADTARPLTNILVGPEESGSGVPQAAAGLHFSTRTARGIAVGKGAAIAGIPADLELASVAVRTPLGAPRPPAEVSADCAGLIAAAAARGRRVLAHVLDQSKTGLLAPSFESLAWPADPGAVDVVVDASQARLATGSVRHYVGQGAMVLLTGSKFFTGPPFAGALLVPGTMAERLGDIRDWPAGFADYFGGSGPPDRPRPFAEEVSLGLLLRWHAALAEMAAIAAIDEGEVFRVLGYFGRRIGAAIEANADLYRHEAPPLDRPGFGDGWDTLPTIFTFSVWKREEAGEARRLLGLAEAKKIYNWLNADLSGLFPGEACGAERLLAARYVHIGQPVALATEFGAAAGAFRFSIGARLVSGEYCHRHLPPPARLEHEIADALTALEKLTLIVRHFERIESADPPSRFR